MTDEYDPEKVDNDVKQFIISVRTQAQKDERFGESSQKSIAKLIICINERIQNKELRKKVLQAITGLPITSQKQLTQWYTSVLIDEIESNTRASQVMAIIEKLVETRVVRNSWDLFPWHRPTPYMPDMWFTNPE